MASLWLCLLSPSFQLVFPLPKFCPINGPMATSLLTNSIHSTQRGIPHHCCRVMWGLNGRTNVKQITYSLVQPNTWLSYRHFFFKCTLSIDEGACRPLQDEDHCSWTIYSVVYLLQVIRERISFFPGSRRISKRQSKSLGRCWQTEGTSYTWWSSGFGGDVLVYQ